MTARSVASETALPNRLAAAVARDELLLRGPGAAAPDEDVGGAAKVVVPVGPDQRAVAGERDGVAEVVERGPVIRGELLLLGPGAAAPDEDVGGAAKAVSSGCPHQRAVAGERDGPAKVVVRGPVARDELLLLDPGAAAPDEDVGGAARSAASVGPDQRAVAGERDGGAEVFARGAVARDELLLLGPGAAALDEDVGRAAKGVRAVCPDEGAVAAERDGRAELVGSGAVARDELLLLGPGVAAPDEDVGRAAPVALSVCADKSGAVAGERDGPAELVELGRVARQRASARRPRPAAPPATRRCASRGCEQPAATTAITHDSERRLLTLALISRRGDESNALRVSAP